LLLYVEYATLVRGEANSIPELFHFPCWAFHLLFIEDGSPQSLSLRAGRFRAADCAGYGGRFCGFSLFCHTTIPVMLYRGITVYPRIGSKSDAVSHQQSILDCSRGWTVSFLPVSIRGLLLIDCRLLLTCTCMIAVVDACQRARQKKSCSFEPTASALGMGHGYQAVAPPLQRSTIPTIYDPAKLPPGAPEPSPSAGEKQFTDTSKEEMSRRDSGLSDTDEKDDKDISGPLSLQKPETVQQMRPARPWSEMPQKR